MPTDLSLPKLQRNIHSALQTWHEASTETSPLGYLQLLQRAQSRNAGNIRQATNEILLEALETLAVEYKAEADLLRRRFRGAALYYSPPDRNVFAARGSQMASISLTDVPGRANFFRQTVLNNLRYWQGWLETNLNQATALDRERNAIAKALSFAFDLDPAWPVVFELVTTLSPLMERRGHWDLWQWVLTRALETAQRMEDRAAEVTLSALLARLLFQQSRYKEAVCHYRRTIRLARQIGDQFNEARACTNLGYHFIEQGRWQRAEVLCCYALCLFEAIDSDHGRAHTENHLGILYTRRHRWPEARQHLERACNIWQAMGDDHGSMRGYLNLGGLYRHLLARLTQYRRSLTEFH